MGYFDCPRYGDQYKDGEHSRDDNHPRVCNGLKNCVSPTYCECPMDGDHDHVLDIAHVAACLPIIGTSVRRSSRSAADWQRR